MSEPLAFQVVDRPGVGTVAVPVGDFPYARIRFAGEFAIERGAVPDGCVMIAQTIAVTPAFVRPIVMNVKSGFVSVASIADPAAFIEVNSSLDRFLSSIVLFELWHQRIVACEHTPSLIVGLIARGTAQLAKLDPEGIEHPEGWWLQQLQAVGRLL